MAWRWTSDKHLPEPLLAQFIEVYVREFLKHHLLCFRIIYNHWKPSVATMSNVFSLIVPQSAISTTTYFATTDDTISTMTTVFFHWSTYNRSCITGLFWTKHLPTGQCHISAAVYFCRRVYLSPQSISYPITHGHHQLSHQMGITVGVIIQDLSES